jgi:DNA invertase Pin-like site-specific DNA recombinase
MAAKTAVAYLRTSSAANVGADKDSDKRQREAITRYARQARLTVVREFYDAAVSGADPVMERPGLVEMLNYLLNNGARTVLVESASRFARDLAVQLAGHDLLKKHGIELVPVDAPDHFQDETPTATMVRNILGAVSQFEKEALVSKLKKARDRQSEAAGKRIEGRKPAPAEHVAMAKKLHRQHPVTHQRMSLRQIAAEMAKLGMLSRNGKAYSAAGIKLLLDRK